MKPVSAIKQAKKITFLLCDPQVLGHEAQHKCHTRVRCHLQITWRTKWCTQYVIGNSWRVNIGWHYCKYYWLFQNKAVSIMQVWASSTVCPECGLPILSKSSQSSHSRCP